MKYAWWLLFLWPSCAGAWSLAGSNIGGWQSKQVTIYYNATACAISEDELTALIDRSIATWNAVSTSGLTLSRSATPSSATAQDYLDGKAGPTPLVVCDVNFQVDNDVDPNLVPAATRVAVSSAGNVNGAGVLLNAQLGTLAEFSQLTAGEQLVAIAHELGHALGLGHSSAPHSLMYYSIGDKTAPTLTQDDMDGLSFLYPRSEFSAGPFGCSAVHAARAPIDLRWALVFLAGVFGIGRLLVHSRPRENQT